MTVHILRHGETEFNRLGIIQGSSVNTDLNDVGRQQAQLFFEYYQHIDFQLVVTSVLKRTHQTVQGFLDRQLPWIQTADINEINWGHHEGKAIDAYWTHEWNRVRDAWNSGQLDARLPGGESAAELNIRLERFINWLRQRSEERILVCSHGRTMRALISLMKGISLADMEGIAHSNTGCYVAEYGGVRFEFLQENSVAHLQPLPPKVEKW